MKYILRPEGTRISYANESVVGFNIVNAYYLHCKKKKKKKKNSRIGGFKFHCIAISLQKLHDYKLQWFLISDVVMNAIKTKEKKR